MEPRTALHRLAAGASLLLLLAAAPDVARAASGPMACTAATDTNAIAMNNTAGDCLWEVGNTQKTLSYWRNWPLDLTNNAITTLVIVVHGAGYNPDSYYRHMWDGILAEGQRATTAIIAPFFRRGSDCTSASQLCWDGGAPYNWRFGGVANNAKDAKGNDLPQSGSYAALDEILTYLITRDRFPNLSRIVVTGQSAGGQFLQRYAMFSTFTPPAAKTIRYVAANPMSIAYINTNERPDAVSRANFALTPLRDAAGNILMQTIDGMVFPVHDTNSWNEDQATFRVPTSADCSDPTQTPNDDWPYGSSNVAATYPHLSALTAGAGARYLSRTVILLSAEVDSATLVDPVGSTPMPWLCNNEVQGDNRQKRIALFFNHICSNYDCSRHSFIVVPGVNHGGGIYDTSIGRRVILQGFEAPGISNQYRVVADPGVSKTLSKTMLKTTMPASAQLQVLPGANYTVSGSSIRPSAGFRGWLTVPVVVRYRLDPTLLDWIESNTYRLRVEVDTMPLRATLFGTP